MHPEFSLLRYRSDGCIGGASVEAPRPALSVNWSALFSLYWIRIGPVRCHGPSAGDVRMHTPPYVRRIFPTHSKSYSSDRVGDHWSLAGPPLFAVERGGSAQPQYRGVVRTDPTNSCRHASF